MSKRWIWALGALLLLTAVLTFFWFQPRPLYGEEAMRILVLGLDEVEGHSRSDTIIVVQADAQGVTLLFVPRDLRVKFPDGQLRKVNAAYALGGVALAREVLADFLDLELTFYVVVDYAGFEAVVDLLGGVELDVEKRMEYEDISQGLKIDLEPGPQLLDGVKALQYVRYRDARGDLGRIGRQQKLLRAVLDKLRSERPDFSHLKELIELAFQHVKVTNLLLPELLGLARRLQDLEPDQVMMAQVPGTPVEIARESYLEPSIVRTVALVERGFRRRPVQLRSEVNVLVLNGRGTSGLARAIRDRLEAQDFRVIGVGNAENFDYATTLVVAQGEDLTAGEWVFAALGGVGRLVSAAAVSEHLEAIRACGQACRLDDPTSLTQADVVVIAGQDYPYEP